LKLRSLFSYPYKIVRQLIRLVKIEFYEYIYPLNNRLQDLRNTYIACNLDEDRENYIKKLNKSLISLGYPKYDESKGMYSEHLIIFAAISEKNKIFKNILEIGTFDGKAATILATLFPYSKITTIDLPDKDPTFINTYSRKNNYEKFIKQRNKLISSCKNINFIQMNSLELSLNKSNDLPTQDLIWVDGAHGYPIVGADITNAIGLMHEGSILMCDDIWKKTKLNDNFYCSTAGFETLSSFTEANIIETNFFIKRIGKLFNGINKYVSFSKLVDKNK